MARRNPDTIARRFQAKLDQLNAQYKDYYNRREFENALATVRRARKLSKGAQIIYSEATCLYRLKRHEQAYMLAKSCPPREEDSDYSGLMAEICGALGKFEEGRAHGADSLRIRDTMVAGNKTWPIPDRAPPARPNDGDWIIAYTLFGANPRYCEVAIRNCRVAATLLPDWRCRFYCDETVPADIRERLTQAGGEIALVDDDARANIHPLMWRFLVADDPRVSRFSVRDADSLIGEREAVAVKAWIDSGKWFHVMRDYYTHCEVMLAGLWGGCAGVISDMRGEIKDFMANDQYSMSHIDQHFLRTRVWPTARLSLLSHDSQFKFFNNEPFPVVPGASLRPEDHVGANLSTKAIAGEYKGRDGEVISWMVIDENQQIVCRYDATIKNGKWNSDLPDDIIERIRTKEWAVRVEPKTAGTPASVINI